MLPHNFQVELMGDRATLRQELIQSLDGAVDIEALRVANPVAGVTLVPAVDGPGPAGGQD